MIYYEDTADPDNRTIPETIAALYLNKMAAASPQERSTKEVINTILDDYEKMAKYVIIAILDLNFPRVFLAVVYLV